VEELPFGLYAGIYPSPKEPLSLAEFQNQQLFLQTAAQTIPGFASSLFGPTWELFTDWSKANAGGSKPDAEAYGEVQSRVVGMIRDWARYFNIEIGWVITEAYDAVILSLRYWELGKDPVNAFGAWRRTMTPRDAIRAFELPSWDPFAESATKYVARADRAWKRARNQYLRDTQDELKKAGLKPVPKSRKRRLGPDLRFTWAAWHRCAGRSIKDLADEYKEDTEAIRISVSRILKDLGFSEPT
jgi:hypothetical protein